MRKLFVIVGLALLGGIFFLMQGKGPAPVTYVPARVRLLPPQEMGPLVISTTMRASLPEHGTQLWTLTPHQVTM